MSLWFQIIGITLLITSLIIVAYCVLMIVKINIVIKQSFKSIDLIFSWIMIQNHINPDFEWQKDWYEYFQKDFEYCMNHPFIWTTKQMWRDPAEYDEVIKYVKEHINDGYNFLDID